MQATPFRFAVALAAQGIVAVGVCGILGVRIQFRKSESGNRLCRGVLLGQKNVVLAPNYIADKNM